MVPGGVDVVIPTQFPFQLMELAVRFLFARWKQGVVANADNSRLWFPDAYYMIPFGTDDEFFVFSDGKKYVASKEDPTNIDMIHLLRRDNELTVVMDPGSVVGQELVDTLTHTKFPGEPGVVA
jgi:hypothetical protein